MSEFSLINRYFKSSPIKRNDVIFGIGDDAACLDVAAGNHLLVSTDTLVSGVHFLPEWSAYDIAYKAVMVNVSDMAAMAAQPAWITLALTIPEHDESWLALFSQGLNNALNQYTIDLVGGDTTRGPLSITVTVMGYAPHGRCVQRGGAQPGDIIMVSGQLGAAALAVAYLNNDDILAEDRACAMARLLHPKARVDLVTLLQNHASAAIDISDGLSADLNHICDASGVGALLIEEDIPLHPLLGKYLGANAVDLALTGGDDYELCFTVSPQRQEAVVDVLSSQSLVCYPVGVIEAIPGLRMQRCDGGIVTLNPKGYSHF